MSNEEKLAALNNTISLCRKSEFYGPRLPVEPLKSLEDIKKLPLTTKEDIRQNSPFGLISVPSRELYQYHETFGTTGTPAATWLTKEDLYDLAHRVNESGIGFTGEDTVLVRFPYAISTVAHFTHLAAQLKNACVIPASSRTTISPFCKIVDLMRKLEVTVLASLPLQAVLIAETAELLGLRPDKDFPKLRAINTAGELLTPRRRKVIEDIWGVPVYDNYGMTEIGPTIVDCSYQVPHPLDDRFIFEVLDDDMRNEIKPGDIGNLVVTTLSRKGTPLIRYITGDRVRMVKSSCKCGKDTTFELRGRKKDVIQVGERIFDMRDLEDMLEQIPGVRFWVVGPMKDGIRFVIEYENQVKRETVEAIGEAFNVKVSIDTVPRGTLCDRHELLSTGEAGKPRYIYSQQELKAKAYLRTAKI